MNIWKRYSMRVSKNWVKFNKMFTLSPWACMDERLAIIAALTEFSRQKKMVSTEMATLVRDQLAKEDRLRSLAETFKNEIAMQIVALGRANKAKSTYHGNR